MRTRRPVHVFTLTEMLVASSVSVVLLGAVVSSIAYTGRNYVVMRTRSELRIRSFLAAERIKKDLHSSASNLILLAPEGGPVFRALSAPVLLRAGDDLTPPVDGFGNIAWTHTVIYHLFTTADGTQELRRTVCAPRDNRMTTQEHYDQLESVMLTGDGSRAVGGNRSTTRTLLRNVREFDIRIGRETIDSYSRRPERRWVYLGPRVLGPGEHTFRFTVTGQNGQATGRDLCLDAVIGTASGSVQDMEHYLPAAVTTGAPAQVQDMSGFAGWSNNRQLALIGPDQGDALSLQIYNDTWCESTFINNQAVSWRSRVTEFTPTGEVVVELAGNADSWVASAQATAGTSTVDFGAKRATIRTLVAGGDALLGGGILLGGPRSRVRFVSPRLVGKFTITDAYIMERASGFNGKPGTVRQLLFKDSVGKSGVKVSADFKSITLNAGYETYSDFVDFEIETAKDYLVTYHLPGVAGEGIMNTWLGLSGEAHSAIIADDPANVAAQADWSGLPAGTFTEEAYICGIGSLFVCYPPVGTYTSQAFDTRMIAPTFRSLTALTSGTSVASPIRIRVRTGNASDMSDAVPWSSALLLTATGAEQSIVSLDSARYIQWQAELVSPSPYLTTPRLEAVLIKWPGNTMGVNLSASIGFGPTNGLFQVEVDGIPTPLTGLWMSFVTGREILGRDYEHSVLVQCEPRNR
jgi:hypothetical protein